MRIHSCGLTDVGRKRTINEDFYLADDPMGLYAVADGVGGHAKGEVASQEAVEQVAMWVHRQLGDVDRAIEAGDLQSLSGVRRMLESGIQQACYMVYGMAELDPEKRGMSTTMSLLLLRGGLAFMAQVGDSRIYRLRDGDLAQLTEDHTLINYKIKQGLITPEQAKTATEKNVITRAVGHRDYVQVDTFLEQAVDGDRYLLCTDGLHGYFNDQDEIVDLLSTQPIAAAARRAIAHACDRGGRDNVTALLIDVFAE